MTLRPETHPGSSAVTTPVNSPGFGPRLSDVFESMCWAAPATAAQARNAATQMASVDFTRAILSAPARESSGTQPPAADRAGGDQLLPVVGVEDVGLGGREKVA